MATISEKTVLELERQRAYLSDILIEKGISVSSDATLGELIPLVNKLPVEDFFVEYANNACTQLVDQRLTKLKSYFCYENKLIEKIDCENVTVIQDSAFEGCSMLQEINLPSLTTLGVYAFSKCTALKTLYLPSLTSWGLSACGGNTSLEQVIVPKISAINSIFSDCPNLKLIDFYGGDNYSNLSSLKFETLIIRRKDKVPTLYNSSYLNNGVTDGLTIYVPLSLIEQYKTATNWTVFADCFVAIEGSPYEAENWCKQEELNAA